MAEREISGKIAKSEVVVSTSVAATVVVSGSTCNIIRLQIFRGPISHLASSLINEYPISDFLIISNTAFRSVSDVHLLCCQ
jgi:hypothetical protein